MYLTTRVIMRNYLGNTCYENKSSRPYKSLFILKNISRKSPMIHSTRYKVFSCQYVHDVRL